MTAPGAPATIAESALRIRPGEGRRTALLFLHLLLASAVFFLGRTVRDTLFLTRYPLSALPWMFVIYGVVSAVIAVLYAKLAGRLPRQRMILLTCAAGAVTYLAAWAAVRTDVPFIYPVFYIWTEIVANLFLVQFWSLASDLHDPRSARRVFGTIGSARLLASVLVGLGTGAVVRAIGTPQLILVLAALMAGVAIVAQRAGREVREGRAPRSSPAPAPGPARTGVLGDPYVRALALLVALAFTAVNIGDFQFKAIARASYSGDELARFFALFYAASGTMAFLFQLIVTPRILARAGVGAGLLVMPAAFGLSSAALLLWPRVLVAGIMKFSDNGFQYTIQETTFQALYVPFPAALKVRARALLDALVKPLGFAAAGGIILWLGPRFAGAPWQLSWISLPLVAGWLALIPVVRRRYLQRLEGTLSARGSLAWDDAFVLDAAGRRMLVRTLWEGTPRAILVALEQLAGDRAADVSHAVLALTAHPDALVRESALLHLSRDPPAAARADPSRVRAAAQDASPSVRAAAALALAAILKDDAVPVLEPLLADPDVRVRGHALGGLLRDGGAAGAIEGGTELGRLLASPREDDLVVAARAMRHLGTGAFHPLSVLLANTATAVRRAAVKSAADTADPRLVPALVRLLEDPACRVRAGQALVAIGAPAVPALGALIQDAGTARAVRLEIPRLLRRIPQPESYARLREHVRAPDSRLRLRLHAALSHLRRDIGLPREPRPFVLALVEEEIHAASRNRAGWAVARARFASPLLEELFHIRAERVVRRILRILELRYDADALALVRERIFDPTRRANALETLDALLDAPARAVVMPFADDGAAWPREAAPDPAAFIASHCGHPNPWVALLALDALARAREPAAASEGMRWLTHRDALVREGAILALAAAHEHAATLIAPLTDDPDPFVARIARRELARIGGQTPEAPMYSTLEKVLFLKNAAIFERVGGEDLAPVARIAELRVVAPGEPIVREGERGDALFIIVRGSATVEHNGRTIATLGPGDPVGEMSVLDSEPRSATVRATEETEVLRIGSEEFYEILHEQVEIAEGVIRVLCRRLRSVDARVA